MTIRILTLFPDFFQTPFQSSILHRAQKQGQVKIEIIDIRTHTTDKHQTTDDRPFGGGPGMVMKVEPIDRALQAHPNAENSKQKKILTSAKGKVFNQALAQEYAQLDVLTIICGHYEGVDERVAEHLIDEEVRIGDYVLTGGEPASLVMVDAITRLLPGVLGNDASNQGESHAEPGVLGYPQYTRPEEYRGWRVPEVLLGGNHKDIQSWREAHRSKD